MPECIECGSYTKYYNGMCYACYKNKQQEDLETNERLRKINKKSFLKLEESHRIIKQEGDIFLEVFKFIYK